MSRTRRTNSTFDNVKLQYRQYLIRKCGLSENTALIYINDLNHADLFMQAAGVINESIYTIRNLHALEAARDWSIISDEFKSFDKNRHQNPGCSLRHYYNFAAQNKEFNHAWNWR